MSFIVSERLLLSSQVRPMGGDQLWSASLKRSQTFTGGRRHINDRPQGLFAFASIKFSQSQSLCSTTGSLKRSFRAFSSLSSECGSPFDKLEEAAETDELEGFPCLLVPFGFDMNTDTGRIMYTHHADCFDDVEDRLRDDPGRYHVLNFANWKLLNVEKNMRTMWLGRYLSPDDSKCVGSSKGWLAFVNMHHGSFYLFNPLIPADSFSYPFIPLPPIETLPTVLCKVSQKLHPYRPRKPKLGLQFVTLESKYHFSCSTQATFTCSGGILPVCSKELSKSFIHKVILSSSPPPFPSNSSPHNLHESGGGGGGGGSDKTCSVMIIHGYNRRDTQLAFCRVGDETWTALNGPRSSYQDIMYLSKHEKFYALCESDHLEAWDLSCPSSPKMTLVKSEYPSLRFFAGLNSGDELERAQLCRKKYLVDSSGELLLVLRYFQTFKADVPEKRAHRLTKCFDVFKLDFDENKWMKVTSLGGRSLFLGTNECISVCAGDYINPGLRLREDSIYFTCVDAEVEPNTTSGAYHLGVFSMKNRKIDVLYQDEYRKMDPHPVWIFPGL